MVLSRRPLILLVDLAAVAALLGLAAAVVFWVVLPMQAQRAGLPRLREQLVAAEERCRALAEKNPATAQALENLESSLWRRAEQPWADVATFIALLSEECRRTGIRLQTVQPLANEPAAGYRSWIVQVRAEGSFPEFQRLLHQIESSSPYVEIRDIEVDSGTRRGNEATREQGNEATGQRGSQAVCRLAWTVRVNYLPKEALRGGSSS